MVVTFSVGIVVWLLLRGRAADGRTLPTPRRRHRPQPDPDDRAREARAHTLTGMRVSARADYAIRALIELAAAGPATMRGEQVGTAQHIPVKYLENILAELRRAGLVISHRGQEGGYRLARTASTITLADIIRAIDGPLAGIRGEPPESVTYPGVAAGMRDVWVALRASMRAVLEEVTLSDVAADKLPANVRRLLRDPDVWERR